jgi:hypothetical protein
MTLEGLFPFILLLIMWGASRILLKVGKTDQRKQAPADKKPGFLEIMQQQLAALEEKDEDEELPDLDEYFQPPSQPRRTDEHEKKSLIETAEDSLQQEPTITSREKVSISPPTGVAKPRPTILQKRPAAMMMNRRKLQNAVIWAEILAPPVALRDQ